MSDIDRSKRDDDIRNTVRAGYAGRARGGSSCCGSSSCCGTSASDVLAEKLGYDPDVLAALPEGANLGLSCGNPTAIASLKEGEVVLDLGSGAGFDVFVAAGRVGDDGLAIGVDMTPEMVAKARDNARAYRERTGRSNVEFRLGEIEHLPVADASVDAIVSNCVINLSPDKPQVFAEMFRVLEAGGRVAVSDLALKQELPEALRESVRALVGCVAGAVTVQAYVDMVKCAGFGEVDVKHKAGAIESMFGGSDPLLAQIVSCLPEGKTLSDYVTSIELTAVKP